MEFDNNQYSYGIIVALSGENSPIELSVQISAIFSIDLSEEKPEKIIENRGTDVLISYVRPVISDIISRSGLPPFVLPYIELK